MTGLTITLCGSKHKFAKATQTLTPLQRGWDITHVHTSTPTKWVIAFFTLRAGGFRDRQCGGEQKRSLCLPEGEKTLCQKGISAPPSIQPGLGETSELLGPRPEVKQRASCPTAFALLTPSSAHPYRASVISGFNKKEPDYKGLHESNKIIWKIWPTKRTGKFNLQLAEEMIRRDLSCCCHNT